MVSHLEPQLKDAEKHLTKLKSGGVTVLHDKRNFTEVKPGDPRWELTLADAIRGAESLLGNITTILKICERQLSGWSPTALPGEGASLKFPIY